MRWMSVLTLRLPAENVGAVLDYYRRARILEASGAVSAQLMVDDADPETVLVTAFWADDAGYRGWLGSPLREEFGAGVLAAAGPNLVATNREYRVVHPS